MNGPRKKLVSYTLKEIEEYLGYSSSSSSCSSSVKSGGGLISVHGISSLESPEANTLVYLKDIHSPIRSHDNPLLKADVFLMQEEQKAFFPEALHVKKAIFFSKNIVRDFIQLLQLFNAYRDKQLFLSLPAIGLLKNDDEGGLEDFLETAAKLHLEVSKGDIASMYIAANVICGEEVRVSQGLRLMGNNFIGPGVILGDNVTLHPGATLYAGTRIGANSIVHAGAVIGADGFGYQLVDGENGKKLLKIPQIGEVHIGRDVEIGANACIDRATFSRTTIGDRVKIDNLVHIAHNVSIGDDSIIAAQTGIAGSSSIGRHVILAGQVGISDHVKIEDAVQVGPQTGIMARKVIPANSKIMGSPAANFKEYMKMNLALRNLAKKR